MNGGRNRGPVDIDGCLSGIGILLAVGLTIFVVMGTITWLFGEPPLICQRFKEIDIIETFPNGWGGRQSEVLVTKTVCAEWVKPK